MGYGETFSLRELTASEKSKFLGRTYGWMAVALLISAASAFFTTQSPALLKLIFGHGIIGCLVLAVAEFVLVYWLTSRIQKMSLTTAIIGFIGYSILNGLTLSSILLIYKITSIATAFFSTAIVFGVMSFYGAKTSRDLTSWGHYLFMVLTGVIIASAVNILISFLTKSNIRWLDIVISIVSIILFTAFTAYDTQKILRLAENSNGNDDYKKVSIIAALDLYLDFINILISFLRIFGKRK